MHRCTLQDGRTDRRRDGWRTERSGRSRRMDGWMDGTVGLAAVCTVAVSRRHCSAHLNSYDEHCNSTAALHSAVSATVAHSASVEGRVTAERRSPAERDDGENEGRTIRTGVSEQSRGETDRKKELQKRGVMASGNEGEAWERRKKVKPWAPRAPPAPITSLTPR